MTENDLISPSLHGLAHAEKKALADTVRPFFLAEIQTLQIADDLSHTLEELYVPLAAWLADKASGKKSTLVVGVNGAQGAGKSTFCALLKTVLKRGFDLGVAFFSIDDIYRTRAERQRLAQQIHPLLATRGVPGTHDVELGLDLIKRLSEAGPGQSVAITMFDKAVDDRCPPSCWKEVKGPVDIILFEGWCVGASPQDEASLATPVNSLEADEDPGGEWRKEVNTQLTGPYAQLFAQLDLLLMLKVPSMESIFRWRNLQERKLEQTHGADAPSMRIMDEQALRRFIMHYERLTRHMLEELPQRADLVMDVNEEHQICQVRTKA